MNIMIKWCSVPVAMSMRMFKIVHCLVLVVMLSLNTDHSHDVSGAGNISINCKRILEIYL